MTSPRTPPEPHHQPHKIVALRALYAQYALNAAGLVPHMIFLVDFVARGLGEGVQTGAEYWVLFGLGATAGPILSGFLADRAGFSRALRLAYLIEACAVSPCPRAWAGVADGLRGRRRRFHTWHRSARAGPGHGLIAHHPANREAAWSEATVSFAVLQAAAAYGLSFVFAHNDGDYAQLFVIGAAALMLALAIDVVAAIRRQGSNPADAETRESGRRFTPTV